MADKRLVAALAQRLSGRVQADVAAQVGVSPQLLSDWKAGRRRPAPVDLFSLERALDLKPGELSRHLGYVPVSVDSSVRADLAGEAARTIGDYLGPDLDLLLAGVEDFDAFAAEVVQQGLRRAMLRMVLDDLESEHGPIDPAAQAWADEAFARAAAAQQSVE